MRRRSRIKEIYFPDLHTLGWGLNLALKCVAQSLTPPPRTHTTKTTTYKRAGVIETHLPTLYSQQQTQVHHEYQIRESSVNPQSGDFPARYHYLTWNTPPDHLPEHPWRPRKIPTPQPDNPLRSTNTTPIITAQHTQKNRDTYT